MEKIEHDKGTAFGHSFIRIDPSGLPSKRSYDGFTFLFRARRVINKSTQVHIDVLSNQEWIV